MGESTPDAYAETSDAAREPYKYSPEDSQRLALIEILSDRDGATKEPWALDT